MRVQASLKVLPNNYQSREDNYQLVDEALIVIRKSNIKHLIGPSQTTLEGEFKEISELVSDIQNYYFNKGVQNFMINVSYEYNQEKFYIDEKIKNINKLN